MAGDGFDVVILDDRAAGAIDHVVDRFGDLADLLDPALEI